MGEPLQFDLFYGGRFQASKSSRRIEVRSPATRGVIVWIDDHHKNDPAAVWGGMGQSGYGKENGWEALRDYTQRQSAVLRLSDDFPDWYAHGGGKRYG